MFKEFREFAMRGNVMDMAVGIIIGAAFGAIVDSLVKDVIMPPVGVMLGGMDFSSLYLIVKDAATPIAAGTSLAEAQKAGAAVLAYGKFINAIISFVIVAFAIFILIRTMNRLKREEAAAPAPPEPSPQEKLLAEIRDLLKARP